MNRNGLEEVVANAIPFELVKNDNKFQLNALTNFENEARGSTVMADSQATTKAKKRKKGGLYIAFAAIALVGGCLPILLSNDFTHENSIIGSDSKQRFLHKNRSNRLKESRKGSKPRPSRVSGLDCEPWGGPPNEVAKEMVYWEDIPQDSQHVSPFYKPDGPPQYFSFEMDFAGWNNVRYAQ